MLLRDFQYTLSFIVSVLVVILECGSKTILIFLAISDALALPRFEVFFCLVQIGIDYVVYKFGLVDAVFVCDYHVINCCSHFLVVFVGIAIGCVS